MTALSDRHMNASSVVMNEIFEMMELEDTIILNDDLLSDDELRKLERLDYNFTQTDLFDYLFSKGHGEESVQDTLDYMLDAHMLEPTPVHPSVYAVVMRT